MRPRGCWRSSSWDRGHSSPHTLATGKGGLIKNTHHYRDPRQQVADLEVEVVQRLGPDLGRQLCALVRRTNPDIYKDQLRGLKQVLGEQAWEPELIERLCKRSRLTATTLRECLVAYNGHPDRWPTPGASQPPDASYEAAPPAPRQEAGTADPSPLAQYGAIVSEHPQEAGHDLY